MSPHPTPPAPPPPADEERRWGLEQIEVALRGLQFGEVTVIVQDGVVVQVDRTERRRVRGLRRK